MKRIIIVVIVVLMAVFLTACDFVNISSANNGENIKSARFVQGGVVDHGSVSKEDVEQMVSEESVDADDVSLSATSSLSDTEVLIAIVEEKCYSPIWEDKNRLVLRGYSTVSPKEIERYITTEASACFVFGEGMPVQVLGAKVDRSKLDDKYGAYAIENYDNIQRYDKKAPKK